jgi:hypothetical protein
MGRATAYDLTQFAPDDNRRRNVRVVKTNKKGMAKRQFQTRFIASVFLLFILMTATVFSQMKLTECKRETIEANRELTEISSENAYLSYELESRVSLRNAEEYAERELGLVRVDSSQIEYVHLHGENLIETQPRIGNELLELLHRIIDFLLGNR